MDQKQLIFIQAALFRGYFINQISYIEKMMEFYITEYFCTDKEKAQEMVEFLTGDRFVSFESKRSAFEWIMKKHFQVEYKANAENFKLLTNMQTHRNRLAHLMLNVTDEALKKFEENNTISFLKFSEKTRPIWYSKEETEQINTDLKTVVDWMKSLIHTKL